MINSLFWDCPFATLTFLSFMMCYLSMWLKKTAWLWGSFLFISFCLAHLANIANLWTLIPIVALFVSHLILRTDKRDPLFLIAFIVSFGLIFHLFPGFHNWKISESLYFNFDKPFIGVFALAFGAPLLTSVKEWRRMLLVSLPLSILGIGIMAFIAICTKAVAWNPKIPVIFFPWVLNNLFLVCISEEAFFRGFVQKELTRRLQNRSWGVIASVGLTTIIFSLAHIGKGNFDYLILVFLAGILYGAIYQYTKSIESSIICHFLLNFTRFLFF